MKRSVILVLLSLLLSFFAPMEGRGTDKSSGPANPGSETLFPPDDGRDKSNPGHSLEYDHAFTLDRSLEGTRVQMETRVKGRVPFELINGRPQSATDGGKVISRTVFDLQGEGTVEVAMKAVIKDEDELCTLTARSPMKVKISGETRMDPRPKTADKFTIQLSEAWEENHQWTARCENKEEVISLSLPVLPGYDQRCAEGKAECRSKPLEFEGRDGATVELPAEGRGGSGHYRFILHISPAGPSPLGGAGG